MARLLLASRGVRGLGDLLEARGERTWLIPDAADPLDEPGIADEVQRELAGAGLKVSRHRLSALTTEEIRRRLRSTDVVAVSGGDPFHLLAVARRVGLGGALRTALDAGTVYVGYSAGAMLVGPTLEPLRLTSPFSPPPGLKLTGLGLLDVLVLPHANRPGRRERHQAAISAFGGQARLIPLRDGDVLVHADGAQTLHCR